MTDVSSASLETSEAALRAQRNKARLRRIRALVPSVIGTLPMAAVSIGVFVVAISFTLIWSFTSTKFFPNFEFVGWRQYERLWSTPRWLASVSHIWYFGVLHIVASMVFGFLLAVFMDQRIRGEDAFRTVFLYPFALSAIITGLIWQWIVDPNLGLQAAVRAMGWTNFQFAPIADANTAIYGLVVATVWNGAGVTMAILLAGLRGIDEDIWKATRIEGIPAWRVYLFIILPMMRGAIATALTLLTVGAVRIFDLEVAMTGGGPGIATRMPASYVIDSVNSRDVAQGMAAAVSMLVPILAAIILVNALRWGRTRRRKVAP